MSFNYLQTDDRDDYFASLGKSKSGQKKEFPFALYADPSRKVYAVNKKEAGNLLNIDINMIGMQDGKGNWIINKRKKPTANKVQRPEPRQIKSTE